jgi:ubiquitin thioesterase protein OTUB1
LVGEKENLISLESEYSTDDIYRQKVHDLASKYKSIRRTRPDGNCFFRGFGFAYFERLLDNPEEYKR